MVRSALSAVAGLYEPLSKPSTWRAGLYHLLDLVVAWLGAALLGLTVVASVLLLPVSPVVVAGALVVVDRLAGMERARARRLLDVAVEAPSRAPRAPGWWGWLRSTLASPIGWRYAGYLIVRFALGNVAFAATAGLFVVAVVMLSSPAWLSWQAGPQPLILAVTGAVLVGVVAQTTRGFAALSRRAVRGLLGPAPDARISRLEGQRSSAVRMADVDRRRIEQDLHDGAQVRLTAVAMQLGLAKEAVADGADPARIAALVDDAHAQAKLALREIRDLARGIHPAILTDRGLQDALASMVARLPVAVDLDVDVASRPSPAVESVVYFVAAEAVTNAVRHADSPTIGLRVERCDAEVIVEIRDRGRGGADPSDGTGLSSLRERVEAAGGGLTVESPRGVGTLVRAVVPCGSP